MEKQNMKKPNIIFILIDDMGWKDLGCYGSDFYETPVIDRLAVEGVTFTEAYAACPVCSPSRASIMTGKYPARVGMTDFLVSNARGRLIDAPYLHYLPLEEKSLAKALKEEGYRTWHIGKWHLGEAPYYPEKHGFDVNVGGCEFGLPRSGYFSPYHIPGLSDGPDGEYLTDRLTQEALRLLDQYDGNQPFYMNLWHYAVHVPIQAPDTTCIDKYREKAKKMGLDQVQTFAEGDYFPCEHKKRKKIARRLVQSDPNYAAMVENLDSNIGRLIDKLKEKNLYEDTILIFTSDNGGLATAEGSPTCNLPLSEGKGWMYDGGVRVPLIVNWPGKVKQGYRSKRIVSSPDFYPTLLEAAGIAAQPSQHVDGVSFMDALRGAEQVRGPIFWHYPHYGNQGGTPCCAIREEEYKLIYFFETERSELYRITEDPGENRELSKDEPQTADRLKQKLFAWMRQVEAKKPTENPDYVPWQDGMESGRDVALPFDLELYDAEVYYCKDMEKFH